RKQWQKSLFEPIVKRHLELCVDLKDHRTAKDGLHQYRNMVQSVDPSSLETIILYLMDLAETRANDARKKSNKVALAAAAKISDLDQEETPESIMLSTMTVDGVKDRTDREVVVPWLKFLWETYRAILELLHKNAKLDKVYLKTCEKALAFCLDYQRTLEFRRLCEIPGWEWTPESIEIHLQIRFNQLEVATTLEQWNEAFRTVEDIYSIMQLGKKTPKPRLMATYYEKLTRIFWVSENYLFHAYAWYRFYSLSCEYRKDIKPEEKSLFASSVLLATLCIPTITDDGVSSGPSPNGMFDDEEIRQEKNQQMALLLDFQANPSRSALLTEIMTKGLLNEVYPELKQLYESMETGFKPLQMIQTIVPVLDFVSASPQISMYRQDLQKIAIVVCTRQLSSVYSTVKIDFLKKLFAPLNIPYVDVEKVLVDALTRNQLNMRVDHLSGCFRFGTTVNIAPVVERQLATTGLRLKEVADKISSQVVDQSVLAAKRKVYLTAIELASRNQHASVIERKMAIERRKEGLERLQRERIDQEDRRKSVEEAVRREE
ncbi:TIF3A1, partial [Symbiodinium microadriaticum]